MTLSKAMSPKEFNRGSGFLQTRAHNDVKVEEREGVCNDQAKDQYQNTLRSEAEEGNGDRP